MELRGNRGDTQRKPYDNEHGRPLSMLVRRATGRYKETGRGNTFIVFPKRGRREIAVEAVNS